MSRVAPQTAVLVLLLVLCSHSDDKKKQGLYTKPAQTADLESQTFVTAKQNCENWGVAAGLENILKKQGVHLDQTFWVTRIYGGELCVNELPSVELLAHAINGAFVLEDGRHVRLELHYVSGAPSNIDDVVAGIKHSQLALLLLRGHAYYLTGVTYDEFIGRNGARMFGITELRLADTFPKLPGATFQKGRDDPAEIAGILSIQATGF
ncbi:MAG TPA: hypothetical protein VG759_22465 [Candidatus Angelobacter sp.]|jgi:hypothetical protein|nr:hypothetical protein [Candidatus Angelobacter sp.]